MRKQVAEKKKKERSPNLGGARPGSGRKRKIDHLSNYDKAIKLLDDNIEEALTLLSNNIQIAKKLQEKAKKAKKYMPGDLDVVKLGSSSADIILRKSLPDRIDMKNEYKKEAAKVSKDMSKLTNEELQYIITGK